MTEETEIEGIKLVPEPTRELLNEREYVDYLSHRRGLVNWSLHLGKEPDRVKGYATSTVENRAYRIDKFYRFVWDQEDGYTTTVTHDHADEYMRQLVYGDHSDTAKANTQKALKMVFKWRSFKHGGELWEPQVTFSGNGGASHPRDYLTREERGAVRESALEYGSVPNYNSLSPQGRDEWKAYLAQRFEMPKREVKEAEFKRANGFKIPSLVWASLDTGLRPVEVERARVQWVDTDNAVLRIPAEESSKGNEHWVVSLQSRTAEMLRRWLEERQLYTKYDGRDELWLTREGNPYQTYSLKYLLSQLCDLAGIATENRSLSWYAIRHSVGTYMAREEGLAAASAQLRHKSVQTTMKYDNTPIEDRRNALNRMG